MFFLFRFMIALNWIVGLCFLGLVSVIDFLTFDKDNGYVPSVLTTLFLIVAFLVNFPKSLFSGVFVALIGVLLTDLDFWDGVADFKCFVGGGMLFLSVVQVGLFAGFVTFFGFLYKLLAVKFFRGKKQVPFVPVLFLSFFVSLLLFAVFG